jgi:hypothetical protein
MSAIAGELAEISLFSSERSRRLYARPAQPGSTKGCATRARDSVSQLAGPYQFDRLVRTSRFETRDLESILRPLRRDVPQ